MKAVPGWLGETAGSTMLLSLSGVQVGHLLRVGLRVAQRHAEPDRAVQLEVVGLARVFGLLGEGSCGSVT